MVMEVLRGSQSGRFVGSLLLLFYLFVLKTAANCPRPDGGENTVLTTESLLLNSFPDGVRVTFECANGYEVESGTGDTICVDSQWTKPSLICKKKDCGIPKPKPHMNFNITEGTLFGAIMTVFCDKGYRVTGTIYKQCYASGWSGKAKCDIIKCHKPAEVANGKRPWDSQDGPNYGDTVTYVCNEGHTLVGDHSIVCNEKGEYDGAPPVCVGATTEGSIYIETTPSPAAREISTTTDPSVTPTAHRDNTFTSTPAAVTTSVQDGGDKLTAADRTTATSLISSTVSTFKDAERRPDEASNNTFTRSNADEYLPAIISLLAISLVGSGAGYVIYRSLLRRKGLYRLQYVFNQSTMHGTAQLEPSPCVKEHLSPWKDGPTKWSSTSLDGQRKTELTYCTSNCRIKCLLNNCSLSDEQ